MTRARCEGTDLRETVIECESFPAMYDSLTKWPEGFDPVKAGAVRVDA